LGNQPATIKLDCKSVVDGVIGNLTNIAEYDTIIRKCKTLLNFLQNFKVSFILRQTLTPLQGRQGLMLVSLFFLAQRIMGTILVEMQ
jgi:hypothetical protein